MSKASVKINSDSSAFQRDMKKAVQSMKELASETSLATTQAKLFGSAQDQLRAKVSGLEAKISQQTKVVELNKSRQEELTKQLQAWKNRQAELQQKIQAAKEAIEQSSEATGKNSAETKALKEELKGLVAEEKTAAGQVEKCEASLSKHTVATNKSEQALVEMRAELKKTNEELKDAAWDEWTEKADKATETMDNVGKKLTVVTGAVVAMGAAAVKTTADFDVGMSNVKAISGATGDEFDALRDKALEMGSKTSFSASEASSAMEYMAMAGWKTEDMLDGIAGVMNAAAASGEDLASTSDILTDGLTAFGMAASDSAHFADVLVAAGNNANTSVAMMGETFKYAGAVCGTLGITVEDCAIATGLMGNAGIKASQAGTALRSGLTNLVSPTDKMATAMKKYGVSVQTTSDGSVDFMATMKNVRESLGDLDETTRAAAISTIFGKEAMSGWSAIVTASDADFQNLTDAIYGCEGAAEAAAAVKLDNLSGQITILKSTIEGIAIQIGDILMPTIRNVVRVIQEWATKFSEADEGTKKTIITIAGVVAAIGPLLLGISATIKTVKNVVSAFKNMKTTLAAVKVALGGPTLAIVGVVAAIAALVAAFMHLWNTNEEFRTAITSIWNKITGTLGGFFEGIKERLTGLGITFESVSAAVSAVWNALCDLLAPVFEWAFQEVSNILTGATAAILGIIDFFVAVFRRDWNGAWEAVKDVFMAVWNYIVDFLENAANLLTGIADVVLGWFGTDWNTAWTAICDFFAELWEGVSTFFTNIWTSITTWISTALNNIKTTFTNIWTAISTTVSTVFTTIKNVIQVAIMFIVELVKAAFSLITLPWQFIWQNCGEYVVAAWEAIKTTVSTAITAVKDTLTTALTAISGFITTIWTSISTATGTAWNAVKTTIASVWNGITTAVTAAANAVGTVVSAIWTSISTATSAAWNNVKTTTTSIWNGVKAAIDTVVNGIRNAVSAAFNAVKSTVSSIWNGIKSATTATWNAIKNAISTPINSAINVVKSAISKIRGAFNFSWSLPKLKMPHPYISGKFSLNPPEVPKFGISWYKTGAIMDGDTIFGMNGNTLLGGGEAGQEAILPLEPFYVRLGTMLDEKLGRIADQAQNVLVYVTCLLDGDEIASRQIVKVEKYMVGTSRAIRRATT